MRIVVDRDSVAMADDVAPHLQVREIPNNTRVSEVVLRMVESYLPHVAGSVARPSRSGTAPSCGAARTGRSPVSRTPAASASAVRSRRSLWAAAPGRASPSPTQSWRPR